MKDKTTSRILAFFLLISAILVIIAVQAARNIKQSGDSSDWVNHTHATLLEIEALRTALYVAEASSRSYSWSNNTNDLTTSQKALSDIAEHLNITQALTRYDLTKAKEVSDIESLVSQHISSIRNILSTTQASKMETARRLSDADLGGEVSITIQRKLKKLKDRELAQLTERDIESYLQAQKTRWTVWAGVTLNVLLLAGVAWLIKHDIDIRRQAAAALQVANEQLELRVKERTAELANANQKLSMDNLEQQWTNLTLEHQLRYNQRIVDSVSDLVFVLTKTSNISRMNPAVLHLSGWETTDLINKPLSHIVELVDSTDDGVHSTSGSLKLAMKEGRDLREQEAFVKTKQGHQTPVILSMFPLRDQDKVVGGVVTIQIKSNSSNTTF